MINGVTIGVRRYSSETNCSDGMNCPEGVCPDFQLKRFDTKPPIRVEIKDCDSNLDLTNEYLVAEASMWTNAKLKRAITADDVSFSLADNVGFDQLMVGDVIVIDRVRLPERMLVTGFDEDQKVVFVNRAYNGTSASAWAKGTKIKIFKFIGNSAQIINSFDDITKEDGTVLENQLIQSFLAYEWNIKDTCTPGCYWFEFKLLKMLENNENSSSNNGISVVDYGCVLGDGVEWVRRFPTDSEGFLIKIVNSYTPES